jgi:ferredoxin
MSPYCNCPTCRVELAKSIDAAREVVAAETRALARLEPNTREHVAQWAAVHKAAAALKRLERMAR